MKSNYENEKLKRRYRKYLLGPQGMAESTVVTIERALSQYEKLFSGEEFSRFNQRRAVEFKRHLEKLAWESRKLSGNSAYHNLRQLKQFFSWLADQPGFKKKISHDAVSYLTLDNHKTQEVLSPKEQKSPSLDYVVRLVASIKPETEIARRDRALIAFLLLSGMRDFAVATLPIGCFDPQSLTVHQDPRRGVRTKYAKTIVTRLMIFDQNLIEPIIDWHRYLVTERLFPNTAPFFPKSKVEQITGRMSYVCTGVSDQFWKNGNAIRDILKKRSAEAELDYFKPHSFRHAAVLLGMQRCATPEEFKAVSQNIGHSHVMTTLQTYGNLPADRLRHVMGQIDFAGTGGGRENEVFRQFMALLKEAKTVVDSDTK